MADPADPVGDRGLPDHGLEGEGAEQGDGVAAGAAALPCGAAQGGPEGLEIGAATPLREVAPDGRIQGREGGTVGGMIHVPSQHGGASFTPRAGNEYQSSKSWEAFSFVNSIRGIFRNAELYGGDFQRLVEERRVDPNRPPKPGAAYEYPKRLLENW